MNNDYKRYRNLAELTEDYAMETGYRSPAPEEDVASATTAPATPSERPRKRHEYKLLQLIASRDFNRRIRCNLVAARYQREIDSLCKMYGCTEEDVLGDKE